MESETDPYSPLSLASLFERASEISEEIVYWRRLKRLWVWEEVIARCEIEKLSKRLIVLVTDELGIGDYETVDSLVNLYDLGITEEDYHELTNEKFKNLKHASNKLRKALTAARNRQIQFDADDLIFSWLKCRREFVKFDVIKELKDRAIYKNYARNDFDKLVRINKQIHKLPPDAEVIIKAWEETNNSFSVTDVAEELLKKPSYQDLSVDRIVRIISK